MFVDTSITLHSCSEMTMGVQYLGALWPTVTSLTSLLSAGFLLKAPAFPPAFLASPILAAPAPPGGSALLDSCIHRLPGLVPLTGPCHSPAWGPWPARTLGPTYHTG